MITKLETTLFFAITVSALALAAVVGIQEFSASAPVQQAVALPMIQLERVEIVGEHVAPTAKQRAPEQVALVR
ncbi:MAG: hypothetical protein H0V63_15765 [Burkholderiaceae bacterium]|nr:hypothetical protein [Burkholderiaceae bacterium]